MYLYLTEFLGKVIYLYLLCATFADGQLEADISVNGDNVVQTNVATYTIYSPSDEEKGKFTIVCLSFLGIPSSVHLLKEGVILRDTFEQSTHSVITEFRYDKDDMAHLQGVYVCKFNFSLSTQNGTQFEYLMQSEVEINTTTSSKVCGSNVGFSGYLKEKVTLFCRNYSPFVLANFSQARQTLTSRYSLQVSLSKGHATFSCVRRNFDEPQENVCFHGFKVYRSLKIDISLNTFTFDSYALNFSCNSTPPRLLYWELIGDDGNTLNLSRVGDLPGADGINIEILQRAGWSSLHISTSAEGNINLDIQKVVCYTYGTRNVAYASRELKNAATASADTSTRSPQTTTSSFGYDAENATTTIFSTNGTPTEQEKTDDVQEPTNIRKVTTNKEKINKEDEINKEEEIHKEEETNKTGEINKWMISAVFAFAIASFEALLLVIIVGIYASRKCRTGDKNQSSKSGFTGNIISSETELHENPVYQAYECDS